MTPRSGHRRAGGGSVAPPRPNASRAPRGSWLLIGAMCAGAAMIVVGLASSTAFWTGVFEHELRTARHGGEVVATTVAGARWWRAALVAAGLLGPSLIAVLIRTCGRAVHSTPHQPLAARTRGAVAAGLVAIVLLGLALRLPRLGESLWYDEIADFLAFGAFGPGATMGNYFTQSNHVLSGILCWASVTIAGGANEVVLRLPALLASLATVPACWWLAREASAVTATSETTTHDGERYAVCLPWCAAAVAAVAPVLVLSVEARGYAFMILASALATAILLRGTRLGASRNPALLWVLYAIVVALGTWAHLVTACVAVGHALLLASDLRSAPRRRAAIAGLSAIALAATITLLLYSPVLPDMLAIGDQFKANDGDEPTLLGPEGLHAILQMGGAWSWWAALPGLVLALIGAVAATRTPVLRRAVAASLLGAGVAVLLAWAGDSWLYARFLLFAMPAAVLLVAAGFATVLARSRGRWPTAGAIVVAMIVLGSWLVDLATRPPKQPLRDAVTVLAIERRPGERVATIGLADNVLDWYGSLRGIEIVPTGPLGRDLQAHLDRDDPTWVVVLYERSVPPARLAQLAERGFTPVRRLRGWVDWGNGDVVIYRRSTEP